MLDGAARVIAQLGGRVRAAVSDAGQVEAARRAPEIRALWDILMPLHWNGDAKDLVRGADVAVVASGTATLETAVLGVPQVIVYKTGWVNYEIAKRLVRVSSIGLANLVAGSQAAPELIQRDATGPRVAAELAKLLTNPDARDAQLRAFAGIPERLGGPGAADRAAAALIEFVGSEGAP
jgi:lipid-A-disaccharide synthase